jgi:hypothetical protein
MAKNPDWLKYQDGFAEITLEGSLDVNGAKLSVIRMREPNVDDQLAMDQISGGDASKELGMMANLCEIPQENLRKLSLRNYKRVQRAFLGFID